MIKKAILVIVLIGIGCAVFFVGYEKNQKMSQDILSEESSVEQAVETEDVLIYWTNRSGRIQRIRSDNSALENLVTDVCAPIGIALDTSGGQMYWTSGCKIQRANLGGSNVEELVPSSEGIALDIAGNKMYWTLWNATTDKIQRANLDGSEVEDIITDLLGPNGIALNLDGNKIYWADEFSGKIQCANLDGSNLKTLFVRYGRLIGTAMSIPFDILNLKIYYADSPIGIALDISGGKIYWTTPHKYKIQRANLDGSNVEDVVTDSILTIGIALSTAP